MAKNSLDVIARYYNEDDDYCLIMYDTEIDKTMVVNTEHPTKSVVLLDWDGLYVVIYELLNACEIGYVNPSYVDLLFKETLECDEDATKILELIKRLHSFKEN